MAFAVPSHLPRGAYADASASASSTPPHVLILQEIAESSSSGSKITLEDATTWVEHADASIKETQKRIIKRIEEDRMGFDRQAYYSSRIKSRVEDLSSRVESLEQSVNNEEVRPSSLQL